MFILFIDYFVTIWRGSLISSIGLIIWGNLLLEAGQCQAVPQESMATASSSAATSPIGTTVTYTCDAGHYFNHATQSRTAMITCQASGQWSTLSQGCTGECRCVNIILEYLRCGATKRTRVLARICCFLICKPKFVEIDYFVKPIAKEMSMIHWAQIIYVYFVALSRDLPVGVFPPSIFPLLSPFVSQCGQFSSVESPPGIFLSG